MKKIVIILLALLLFTSCGVQPNGSTSAEPSNQSSNYTTEPTISSFEQTTASTEPSLPADVFLENEPYSFSEVDSLFGPGPFSVNELAEIFGEPTYIYGSYSEESGENSYFVLHVQFKWEIMFDLAANNGEKLNFIVKDDSKSPTSHERYEVTDSDKDVRMKPRNMCVFGGHYNLPRNLELGDSRETLYNAYNGNKGKERFAQGLFMVSYDYGDSGRITYAFEAYSIDEVFDELEHVSIEWYDAYDFGWSDDDNGDDGVEYPRLPAT